MPSSKKLYCLRKLRLLDISSQILQMFFTSAISSVLTFGCVCWGGNISKQDRDTLDKIIKKAESVVGKRQDRFDTYHQGRLTNKLTDILHDDTHPLKADFDKVNSFDYFNKSTHFFYLSYQHPTELNVNEPDLQCAK